MTLLEYATHLEKSTRPGDAAVARYIRTHEARLLGWVRDFSNGMSRADREELLQVALLACVEAVRAPDADTALNEVKNAMQRHARHEASWRARRVASKTDDNSAPNGAKRGA